MDRVHRWLWPLAVVGLLAAGWLASAFASPQVTRLPLARGEANPGPEPSRTLSRSPGPSVAESVVAEETPTWLPQVIAAVCLVIALAVAGLLVLAMLRAWSGRTRPLPVAAAEAPRATPSAEEVVAALDEGLAALSDAEADPRRAVIACWVRLEEVAAAAGTPRQVGDTPTELVGRLLAAHRVSRPVLARFAALYREARYATHAVDERMRETALSALRQLRGDLAIHSEPAVRAADANG